ncbi:MAG TPA: hypothetical protein VMR00_13390 [Streptosporangiaceae bacterium]|nr:hypothetical protein [Streptosporangiaceae bacterium]
MSNDLERRYLRVLRLLPGWYRQQWEQDMVAAFLDSWLTGDPEADEYVTGAAGPSLAEVASVAVLAARLYLVGPGIRRRFAWGHAIRRAVLAVILVHALLAVNVLVFLVGSRRLAARAAREPAGCLARRRLGHGVLPGVRRMDRGLPDADPRALPRCPGPRCAGRHPRPGTYSWSPFPMPMCRR